MSLAEEKVLVFNRYRNPSLQSALNDLFLLKVVMFINCLFKF